MPPLPPLSSRHQPDQQSTSSTELSLPLIEAPRVQDQKQPGSPTSSVTSSELGTPKQQKSVKVRSLVPYQPVESLPVPASAQTSTETVPETEEPRQPSRNISRASIYPARINTIAKEPFGDYSLY